MLLAVDTSTAQVGLALYDGPQGQVVAEYAWRSSQRHTVELAPAVFELLDRCGVAVESIHALGVALGPGSFTSLRVGLSFAKGLALSRQLPLVGVPTLEILASAQSPSRLPLVVAIQAGRGRLAAGWFEGSKKGWKAQGPARVVTIDALMDEMNTPALVCGELTFEQRQKLSRKAGAQLASPARCLRRPAILAELAWLRWQAGDVDDEASLAPIYVHVAGSIPA